MTQKIEIIDSTRLKASLACLRLYYYSQERNWVPARPRLPLIYGNAVHETLASHYRGETAGQSLAAFQKVWESELFDQTGNSLLDEMADEDPKRNPRRWMETFMLYREHYKKEPWSVIGKPESPFFLPISDDLAISGIIDLPILYLNQVMIMDHKTSYNLWNLSQTVDPNLQADVYLYAANQILKPDKPITTLLFNGILSHATEMRPEKLFDRIPTTRSPEKLQVSIDDLKFWWNNVVRVCRAGNHWPKNDSRCNDYGGCVYRPLCCDITADYRKLKPSPQMFIEKQWDPMKELRERGLEVMI